VTLAAKEWASTFHAAKSVGFSQGYTPPLPNLRCS
jgi:hypothetical protein